MVYSTTRLLVNPWEMLVQNNKKHLMLLLLLTLLTSCYRPVNSLPYVNPRVTGIGLGAGSGAAVLAAGGASAALGAGIGGLMGLVIADDLYRRTPPFMRVQQELQFYGVQIVRIGEEQKIIVPAGRLFYNHSPRLQPSASPVLRAVVRYMRHYDFVGVSVDGYTNDRDFNERNLALSQLRAENVADYLWQTELDNRLITASGFASAEPIATNDSSLGRLYNERIEIHFRVLRA